MNREQLKQAWLAEERHVFSGWDFSHLASRWLDSPLSWDYKHVLMQYLHKDDRLLDMGTGGGEFLLSLGHRHQNTAVTEGWAPNIGLCMQRLKPLGIEVYAVQDDARLPIAQNSFDIVINRHEAYDLREVGRILKPGGMFITQQVGGNNCASLRRRINRLPAASEKAFSLGSELPRFQECGFLVDYADECYPELRFLDVGAIVFYAKIIEWSFPDFSVEKNFEQLCALEHNVARDGYFATLEHRFIIAARNGKSHG